MNEGTNDKLKAVKDAYFGKPHRLKTWSGIPVNAVYAKEDARESVVQDEFPGLFPFTRGLHKDGYRGKLWTRREVCGYGTGRDTNARLKFLMKEGESGLSVIFDIPTMTGLDADHPDVADEIGVQGTSISCLDDMRELTRDIPLDEASFSLVITSYAAPVILSMYLACAEERGIRPAKLRGTIQNDPLHHRFCGYPQEFTPADLSLKTAVDIIEYSARNMPLWYPQNVNAYDLRENGLSAPQEIAFSFAMAFAYIDEALARGLHIDEFAPRIAFYCSCHSDLFEEAAKLRAMRRLWAKLMKKRYNPKNERSLHFRFGVHTAGITLVPQQPLNNVVRIAYQALSAVLGGAQSVHCCSYDEPVCLPTEESHRLAVRTQQILAFETGVGNVADPLGGSYYVEALTDKLEKEAMKILDDVEKNGGIADCIKSGWMDGKIEEAMYQVMQDIKSRERIVVGVNAFTIAPGDDTVVPVHRVPKGVASHQKKRLRAVRKMRDAKKYRKTLREMFESAREDKKRNLIPIMMDAVKAGATLGEIMGVLRMAWNMPYDPLEKLNPPPWVREKVKSYA